MSKNEDMFKQVKEICYSWFSNRFKIDDDLMQFYLILIHKFNKILLSLWKQLNIENYQNNLHHHKQFYKLEQYLIIEHLKEL